MLTVYAPGVYSVSDDGGRMPRPTLTAERAMAGVPRPFRPWISAIRGPCTALFMQNDCIVFHRVARTQRLID